MKNNIPGLREQASQLKLAGWVYVKGNVWKAPYGGYFLGPYGAWLAMKRRELEQAEQVEKVAK